MNKISSSGAQEKANKGKFSRGKNNAITDIKNVKVAHLTLNKDTQDSSGKKIFLRTGATAVLPYPMEQEKRLFLGSFTLRGKAEMTGYEVTDDFCYLNSPIVFTNSSNVGIMYDAILSYGFSIGRSEIWPPVVIGINDSYLNDMRESFLEKKDIIRAFHSAGSGQVEQGSVGIGLGLRAFEWKGGIGTSSRVFAIDQNQYTCGVLAATNHANEKSFTQTQSQALSSEDSSGSLILAIGVDVPLVPYQIKQIVSQTAMSLDPANTLKNCSDSVVCLLFSTANEMNMEKESPFFFDFKLFDDPHTETIIRAISEAAREAIINSLLKASPVDGKLGRFLKTIPENELTKQLSGS
ncbi:P1 family peptidase [Acidobacteriota bacterium]